MQARDGDILYSASSGLHLVIVLLVTIGCTKQSAAVVLLYSNVLSAMPYLEFA